MSQAEPGGSWDTFCLAGRHAMNMFSIDWQGRLISAFGHPVFPRLPTALGHIVYTLTPKCHCAPSILFGEHSSSYMVTGTFSIYREDIVNTPLGALMSEEDGFRLLTLVNGCGKFLQNLTSCDSLGIKPTFYLSLGSYTSKH